MHDDIPDMLKLVRDPQGRFLPGCSGNYAGRSKASYQVAELAKEHTVEALNTLIDLMRTADTGSTRLAAAVAILDRGWGKPVSKQETKSQHVNIHETLKLLASQVKNPPKLYTVEDATYTDV